MYQLGTAAPEKDKMIMEPFNGVFFGCVAIFVFLLILSTIWARRQSEATRKTVCCRLPASSSISISCP